MSLSISVQAVLNNCSFLLIWIFFFQAFGKINGWGSTEVIVLQAFTALAYGLAFSFFSGAAELPVALHNGFFDSLLLTPKNLYLRILTLVTRISAIGDILFGVLFLIGYVLLAQLNLIQIGVLISLLIPATLFMINLLLITSCLGFFIPDARELGKAAFEIVFGPSLYPAGIFQGGVRFFFIFIFPALIMGGLPIEAVQEISWEKVLTIWIVAIVWTFFAISFLNIGRKRYESGNLTGARV